jgi:hypothetical protein
MKALSLDKSCMGLDRRATWDEVCYALASSAKAFSRPGASDASCDLESEFVHRFDVDSKKPARMPLSGEKLVPRRK